MMKILQETASSQTLKVIPRSYPSIVDVVITNEDTKTSVTYEDLTATSNLGYLEIDNVYTLEEDTFYSFEVWDKTVTGGDIKFIAANNEYITSPDDQYLPDTIAELDIEIDFELIGSNNVVWFGQGILPTDTDYINMSYNPTTSAFGLALKTGGTALGFGATVLIANMTGNIKIQGNGTNLEIYLNDVLIVDQEVTISQDLTNVSGELYFGTFPATGFLTHGDVQISRFKINNNIWTFTEQTGSTTTNSESVVSTLNSDVSTEAMWFGNVYTQNEIIYKGKIFCTNQTDYSINDGEYTTRSRNNKYTTYE